MWDRILEAGTTFDPIASSCFTPVKRALHRSGPAPSFTPLDRGTWAVIEKASILIRRTENWRKFMFYWVVRWIIKATSNHSFICEPCLLRSTFRLLALVIQNNSLTPKYDFNCIIMLWDQRKWNILLKYRNSPWSLSFDTEFFYKL